MPESNMDGLFINARIRIYREKVLHIHKRLPASLGKVNVVVGQEVSPGDVLGEGQTQVGFRTIHLTSELGIDPRQAALHLKRKLGQTIFQGELLAERKDLFGFRKKLLISPVDGVVDFIDEEKGNLRLKLVPKPIKLISGVCGVIDAINERNSDIVIRTLATVVYGILGSGREREGILKVVGSASDLIGTKQICEAMRGQIIVGGGLIFPEALQKAASCGVAGVVSGGINAGDFKAMAGEIIKSSHRWSDVGLTIMVTEGFGSVIIGEDIFSILQRHNGKYAFLDGNNNRLILPINDQSSMICIRKTRLPVNANAESRPDTETVGLKVGMAVRIVYGSAIGFQGAVETIDKSLTELPSGIKSYMVAVSGKRQKIMVPYQNLEAIG